MRQYFTAGELPVEVTVPSAPDEKVSGKLTFIDNAIASATGTLTLRATMPNKEALLWPGLFVNVDLVLTTLQNAIVIPSQCVMVGQQGPYVFVVDSNNTVTRRQLELGQRHADSTVISKGLNAGDRVVTAGQLGLDDGKAGYAASVSAPSSSGWQGDLAIPKPGEGEVNRLTRLQRERASQKRLFTLVR